MYYIGVAVSTTIEKSINLNLVFLDPVQERSNSHVNARNSLHTASCSIPHKVPPNIHININQLESNQNDFIYNLPFPKLTTPT